MSNENSKSSEFSDFVVKGGVIYERQQKGYTGSIIRRWDDEDAADDGEIRSIYNFKNGLKDGKCIKYHCYEKGVVSEETNYKDGEYHGKYTEWEWDGSLIREYNFKNGKSDGIMVKYYKDGDKGKKHILTHKNDLPHGLSQMLMEKSMVKKFGGMKMAIKNQKHYTKMVLKLKNLK